MTAFKDELEKIIQDLQNGDGFSHAFPKAPLSDRSIAATQAIIELVDRELPKNKDGFDKYWKIYVEDEASYDDIRVMGYIEGYNQAIEDMKAKLGVKNNE